MRLVNSREPLLFMHFYYLPSSTLDSSIEPVQKPVLLNRVQ
jgi:hypothetical protein